LEYWKYFKQSGTVVYLSVIVVSEFEVKQSIPDEIRLSCVPLVFNWEDAIRAAKFNRVKEKSSGVERDALKDDFKIIAHAAGQQDVGFVITDDTGTFSKYCRRLLDDGKVKFKTITLSDGFDTSHFGERQLFDNPPV
jgi:hypothetical protein